MIHLLIRRVRRPPDRRPSQWVFRCPFGAIVHPGLHGDDSPTGQHGRLSPGVSAATMDPVRFLIGWTHGQMDQLDSFVPLMIQTIPDLKPGRSLPMIIGGDRHPQDMDRLRRRSTSSTRIREEEIDHDQ